MPAGEAGTTTPLCEYFGTCGGCLYQDIPYVEELAIKEAELREILAPLELLPQVFEPIQASPREYHYRNRLDVSLKKTRDGSIYVGFKPEGSKFTIEVGSCAIACEEISGFLPELKRRASEKLPEEYTLANLVVKTGDDGRVFWGGFGRRSLSLPEADYLWTEVLGRRIFYSLDTFFQANLSILPRIVERMRQFPVWSPETVFYDLYSGVGLFGISLYDRAKTVVMIEEGVPSIQLARYNVKYHGLSNVEIFEGKVEQHFIGVPPGSVALIDPPRKGLSKSVLDFIADVNYLEGLFYLSCNPQALLRDLLTFARKGWTIVNVMPFDFFPKTKHLETLVFMRRSQS